MKNFDIIKDIDGLRTIYRYCATAEDFQVANPMVSATQARLALETMVKTVYRQRRLDEAHSLCAQNRKQCCTRQ